MEIGTVYYDKESRDTRKVTADGYEVVQYGDAAQHIDHPGPCYVLSSEHDVLQAMETPVQNEKGRWVDAASS